MMFGDMQATILLNEYTKSKLVHHPDVSAAMVLASLQKDVVGRSTVLGTVVEHTTMLAGFAMSVVRNAAGWKVAKEELKQLKHKNPSFNS